MNAQLEFKSTIYKRFHGAEMIILMWNYKHLRNATDPEKLIERGIIKKIMEERARQN